MKHPSLIQTNNFPPALLDIDAKNLYTIYPQPTLLHLIGKKPEPLFISILQHGNEITGLSVIQQLLRKYSKTPLPRSISIFFGNTQAARYGKRVLDGEPDYNRVWPGTIEQSCIETSIMNNIVEEMKSRNVFASIDIHNNTGLNPHYACINRLDMEYIQLAAYFSHTVVYFLTPKGVQSMAFSEFCPAVTIECGKSDSNENVGHVYDYVDTILHLDRFKENKAPSHDIDLFHTVARVTIPNTTSFSFTDCDSDIFLRKNLDMMNFSEVPANTSFGLVSSNQIDGFNVLDENEEDVSDKFFYINNKEIKTVKPIMPAMLTLDESVIKQDCFCYLMERMEN